MLGWCSETKDAYNHHFRLTKAESHIATCDARHFAQYKLPLWLHSNNLFYRTFFLSLLFLFLLLNHWLWHVMLWRLCITFIQLLEMPLFVIIITLLFLIANMKYFLHEDRLFLFHSYMLHILLTCLIVGISNITDVLSQTRTAFALVYRCLAFFPCLPSAF